ncbi:hypothetical protein NHX12_021488 [Muraenolepis orangiensis]|uniref:Platelet-derived growth factor receptor-like protein n=1 Tax=Muraenolepis orangiensis TaxID=630683 RepID=A0A9Q0IVK6_9TELE|nr:hypothetical protein NHX12_021488 [Muraenolepis orangiensis]
MNLYFCIFILCGLSHGVFGKDKRKKGRFSVPSLDVKGRHLILPANQTLTLNCRGRWELEWALPKAVPEESVERDESRCGRTGQHYCSRLTLGPALVQHTGSFRCRYRQRAGRQNGVYVYVTDSQQPFVRGLDGLEVLYMTVGQPLVVPCRVTHPAINVSLVKYGSMKHQRPDRKTLVWNSRQGFTVLRPNYFYTGLFYCQAVVDGVPRSSEQYLVHRPVHNIIEAYLNTTGPVRRLKGERLDLNCTAIGEFNTRVNFTWEYPGKNNSTSSERKRMVKNRTHLLFYSVLTLPKLQRADRGLYTCRVTSGTKAKARVKVNIIVYAFPPPQVIWLKDGMVAAERCSRYRVNDSSLVIRDVAEEDAGKYTVMVGNQEHGLYRNLTLTLVVNVRPQIGEKAVTSPDPAPVPHGSRQALHCTSHGVPSPDIQWQWHPCPADGL